jgi:HD-like signal output (HDOD) protein
MEGYITANRVQLAADGRLTKEERLQVCVRGVLHGEGVPPFCDHANEVMVRTLDLNGSSKDLVRLILKDLGLTSQILRLANSSMYNRSGRSIMSVAHGLTLLGWNKVRNMVSTVRYIEHFVHRSPGVRELVLSSVLTALHGRGLAAAIGYPRPEEAYICGLFRNLGEVLVACHCPQEYSRIILTLHQESIPERAACLRVLGFAWDEVGLRVASGWDLSRLVLQSMDPSQAPAGSDLERCLASITNYALDLTCALHRKGAQIDSVHLQTVIDPFGQTELIPVRDLCRIVDSAVSEARETFSALAIPVERLLLSQQAKQACQILESAAVFAAADLNALDRVVRNAAGKLDREEFDLTPFIAALLDALRKAGFDRVVFGLMNENMTYIRGRLASAELADDFLDRFQFPMDEADGPIRAALQRKEDLYVERSRDARYDGSTLVAAFDPGGFALVPIVIEGKTAGCLYADLECSGQGLNAIRAAFGRVRDLIASAIHKKASQSAVTAGSMVSDEPQERKAPDAQ